MKVEFTDHFIRVFKKRFRHQPVILDKFSERTRLFIINPKHPLLRDHALVGSKFHYRSFSVTGDIRVLYEVVDEVAYFVDIGTHNQVY